MTDREQTFPEPRNSVQRKCRHPKRLWDLSRDRRFALCGNCGLRVAVLTATSVYNRRHQRG